MKKLGIVIPVYGQFAYAAKAVASAYADASLDMTVVVVNDASPDWNDAADELLWAQVKDRSTFHILHHLDNKGLTAGWNDGLCLCRALGCDYICVANSDVIFAPCWWKPLFYNLEHDYLHLVGPVTNAPGTERHQEVNRYMPAYILDDYPGVIESTAEYLYATHGSTYTLGDINGFCMMAKTLTWFGYAYEKNHVFKPRNDFNSKGQRNPTPLMTLNEYELQHRWKKAGLRAGFCPGSFVFHYRAVSRGEAHKRGKWYRMKA